MRAHGRAQTREAAQGRAQAGRHACCCARPTAFAGGVVGRDVPVCGHLDARDGRRGACVAADGHGEGLRDIRAGGGVRSSAGERAAEHGMSCKDHVRNSSTGQRVRAVVTEEEGIDALRLGKYHGCVADCVSPCRRPSQHVENLIMTPMMRKIVCAAVWLSEYQEISLT
jgi:hypothetical protein